jgi:cell division protein FtsA
MSKAGETRQMFVGLDIGTSKIVAIVAELTPEGGFEVIGLGSHPSRGLKKGVVVNIETTVDAIRRALEEVELMAGATLVRCTLALQVTISEVSTRTAWWRSKTEK